MAQANAGLAHPDEREGRQGHTRPREAIIIQANIEAGTGKLRLFPCTMRSYMSYDIVDSIFCYKSLQ